MSDIAGELARVSGAFEQPTLKLLHQRTAQVIIAIFRSSFSRDTRTVPTDRLHDQVDTYLAELRLSGVPDRLLPAGSGRDLCMRWMRGQWLMRDVDDDGNEVYALTSHAQDALNLVRSLTRERANLSEHRIATIVSAVRKFNSDVNPDVGARVGILNSEIYRLTRERDRLVDGGDLTPVSADYMLEGYTELLQLVADLPSDFARVVEAYARFRADILASFRAENRPAGEVIDDYLRQADSLTTSTAEGRAFEGAFALLNDDEVMTQLRQDLTALLEHPIATDILNDADRRELRGTFAVIRHGLTEALAMRNRVTATLREYIVTHDITRDHELDATLRALDSEIATWMETARPRDTVPLPLLPHRVNVTHLRERFYDPASETEPPPLVDRSDDARPGTVTLDALLSQGGPSLAQLRGRIERALDGDDPVESLGEIFASLDDALRRPVEIFGLLHLAANRDQLQRRPDEQETYQTIRPDGSSRLFAVPKVTTHSTDHVATDVDQDPPPGRAREAAPEEESA